MPTYTYLGKAPAFGGQCEAWVEDQLLGHAGVYANPLVALSSASDAVHTSDPNTIPAGVAVVFGPADSNDGQGHSGVSLGGGQVKSVWSDGSVVVESIAQFASDNGAPLLGYHDFGRGVPEVPNASAPTSAAPSAPTFLPHFAGVSLGPLHLTRDQAFIAGAALAYLLLG